MQVEQRQPIRRDSFLLIRVSVAMFAGVLLAGCTGFRLRSYESMQFESRQRTRAVRELSLPSTANRAATLPGRSQAEIKTRVESLWQPSHRLAALVNYNGLLATRYSQLDTTVGPVFHPRELAVPHLGRTVRVRAIEAFHSGRRLPLVVGISGINGTVDGKITVDILHSLYDSGDFHVVHLESLTSVNHQVRNQQPFLGGFPEGLLLYEVVAELRKCPDLADQISQVHLLGVSYGGMLCGIAAHCEDKFQGGVVDGAVLALSPPMDLATLFHNLDQNRLIHDRVHRGYLEDGLRRYVRKGNFGLSERELDRLDFDSYVRHLAFPQFRESYASLKDEYPDLMPVNSPDELYRLSSIRPYLATLGVPFFFVYAYDDPVLSPGDHFEQTLKSCSNPLVEGVLLENGGHLGYDAVAGNPFSSRVARDYFRYWSVPPSASGS